MYSSLVLWRILWGFFVLFFNFCFWLIPIFFLFSTYLFLLLFWLLYFVWDVSPNIWWSLADHSFLKVRHEKAHWKLHEWDYSNCKLCSGVISGGLAVSLGEVRLEDVLSLGSINSPCSNRLCTSLCRHLLNSSFGLAPLPSVMQAVSESGVSLVRPLKSKPQVLCEMREGLLGYTDF